MSSGQLLPGVDKLFLHTRDFMVDDYRELHIKKSIPPHKTETDLPLLFIDSGGNAVHGTKVHAPKGRLVNYELDIDKNGMLLNLNPSKAFHPWKLESDVNKVEEFILAIHKDCKELGLHFNLNDARIKRIDLAKQDFMGRSTSMYGPAYDFMKMNRAKKLTYPSGATFGNKQTEVCFYDKGEEQKQLIIKGMLRAESRFLKHDKVSMFVGVNTVSDLLKTDCYVWDDAYKKHMNSSLFNRIQPDLFVIDFDSEVERFRQIAKIKERNLCLTYMAVHGVNTFLSMPGGIETLRDIIKTAGVLSDRGVNKFMKDIDKILSLAPKKDGVVSVLDLVNELKLKFAA